MRNLTIISYLALLGACSGFGTENEPVFDGIKFNTKITVDKANPAAFEIWVAQAGRSIDGAREAGRFRSTVYCIKTYGASDVYWIVGPDQPTPIVQNGDLYLKGACHQ